MCSRRTFFAAREARARGGGEDPSANPNRRQAEPANPERVHEPIVKARRYAVKSRLQEGAAGGSHDGEMEGENVMPAHTRHSVTPDGENVFARHFLAQRPEAASTRQRMRDRSKHVTRAAVSVARYRRPFCCCRSGSSRKRRPGGKPMRCAGEIERSEIRC